MDTPTESGSSFVPPANKLVDVSLLGTAGLRSTDATKKLYCRDGVKVFIDFVTDVLNRKKLGLIDGVPGTGKSTTLWYKMLRIAQEEAKKVVWIHFNRSGAVDAAVQLEGTDVKPLKLPTDVNDLKQMILGSTTYHERGDVADLDADVLVLDGVNHNIYTNVFGYLFNWRNNMDLVRTAFLTMSNKIQREHLHTIRHSGGLYNYHTQYSWTLEELNDALVNTDGTPTACFEQCRPVFEKEWEIELDNLVAEGQRQATRKRDSSGKLKKLASLKEIVSQKYATTGGSAQWMFEMTSAAAEAEISKALNEADIIDDILKFNLGPGSSRAKTHLYSSAKTDDDGVIYGMVSERAAQLVARETGTNGIKSLYTQAAKLQNPAFLGWVVEADYFDRSDSNKLTLFKGGSDEGTKIDSEEAVTFDHAELKLLLSYDLQDDVKQKVEKLIPAAEGTAVTCKPKAWNQGGYDVVRIEKDQGTTAGLHLRFGQVTKSISHSLKLKYFREFASFLEYAGYSIVSIEIGFILPKHLVHSFSLTSSRVTPQGLLGTFQVYGSTNGMWALGKEHQKVEVYGLDMTEMGYAEVAFAISQN